MASREQNERKFGKWDELPTGGRRYWLEVAGHHGWRARYVKEVDGSETTTRFWRLLEIHQKFPVDDGHRRV